MPVYFSVFQKRIIFLLFLIGLSPLLPGPAEPLAYPAQSKTQAAQESLQHEVTVTLKLIQVYVADPKGEPVRDLEKSDFRLYDNDKPQIITDFEKHFLSVSELKLKDAKLPPARDVASLMNRKFLFILDYESNDFEGIGKSKKAVFQFLDTQVQPGDEIALFSFSRMRGLVLYEYLTSDHQKIRTAIKKVLDIPVDRKGWDPWADLGHSILGPETLGPASAPKGDPGLPAIVTADGSSKQTITISSSASQGRPPGERSLASCLNELSKALRHIPGQKNIVLFSRGFGGRVLSKPREIESKAFQAMGKALASANSPVFSVNTTAGSVEQRAKVLGDGTLEQLSKLTGGKYFHDINHDSKIAEDIQSATSNYYVLGYSIASNWDGKFHDIRVDVKRPAYRVYAQKGYFNPLPFDQLTPIEKHLHLLDLALGEKAYFEQHLNFPLIALPFSDSRESNTVLISEIPVQGIREFVGDNAEFIILVFDPSRTIVDSRKTEIDWRAIGQETIRHYSTLALAPGRYDCRVIIRNMVNGRAAVGACSVAFPEKAAAGLKLYPPLLLVTGPGSQYLHIARQGKDPASKSVSLSRIYPYPAKQYVPLVGVLESGTSTLYAELRCAGEGSPDAEIQLSAWLAAEESGLKISMPFHIIDRVRGDDVDIFFLEFEIPNLKPGRYSLRILAEDEATKSTSRTESRFIVDNARADPL